MIPRWADVRSFAIDDEDSVFVVGNAVENGYRTVAKVVAGAVVWDEPVASDDGTHVTFGTPVILLTALEMLLCSKSFFARVEQSSGATLFLRVEASLWLPESRIAVVAYHAASDSIISAAYVDGLALLRQSNASTGATIATLDFTTELV